MHKAARSRKIAFGLIVAEISGGRAQLRSGSSGWRNGEATGPSWPLTNTGWLCLTEPALRSNSAGFALAGAKPPEGDLRRSRHSLCRGEQGWSPRYALKGRSPRAIAGGYAERSYAEA